MPYTLSLAERLDESDADILGALPDQIRHREPDDLLPGPVARPHVAPAHLAELEAIVLPVPVKPYVKEEKPAEPRHSWLDKNREDLKLTLGSIGIALLIYAILVGVSVL